MPTVGTNGVETYYERRGEGRSLVFVHGGWADHRMWRAQVDRLADDYDVVVYDLRGHGRTGPSSRRRYTVDLFASDLHALVQALSLDRPIVCGLSFGGMVAQAYAASYPADLRALVLSNTAVSTKLTDRDRLLRLAAPAWSLSTTVDLLGTRTYADLAFLAADWVRGPGWLGSEGAVRGYLRGTMAQFDRREFGKVLRAIYAFDGVDLDRITVPTLVVSGEQEDRSVVQHAAYLTRTLPDARSTVVPDAGHVPNMEQPDAFCRVLTEFFESLPT